MTANYHSEVGQNANLRYWNLVRTHSPAARNHSWSTTPKTDRFSCRSAGQAVTFSSTAVLHRREESKLIKPPTDSCKICNTESNLSPLSPTDSVDQQHTAKGTLLVSLLVARRARNLFTYLVQKTSRPITPHRSCRIESDGFAVLFCFHTSTCKIAESKAPASAFRRLPLHR